MAAYINCRIWWCKDRDWFNYQMKTRTSVIPVAFLNLWNASSRGLRLTWCNQRPSEGCATCSVCTVANVCAPCVKTSSHFIFSWWHIPPRIPSPLAPCFFCNDLTAAGEISWAEDYYKHSVTLYCGRQVFFFFSLHHVVFLLVFQCSLVGNHLVSENVLHLCWPSRSN